MTKKDGNMREHSKIKIIDFIKSNPNWRDTIAATPYHITIVDDGDYTILKYSQMDSDFTIDIVRECRGLIINKELNVVCVPFFKFGNYGESYADNIDWSTACVEEKIDGSLIKLWHDRNRWIVSTNGTIFAEKATIGSQHDTNANDCVNNFAELFKMAADNAGLSITSLNYRNTYMFEVCSPYNRVVVPHEEIKLYHIGTRDNLTLLELETDIGIAKPRRYECNNIDDLIEMASKLKYCEEGYVVKDSQYRRIKVKSPAYVAVHHLINGMNEKRLLELIRKNETAEFLTYFPEYKQAINDLLNRISAFEAYLNGVIDEMFVNIHFETRKDFAAVATKTKFPAFFFNWYDQKVKSPMEWLWNQNDDNILGNLERLGN